MELTHKNFSIFKVEFLADTNLHPEENWELFFQYYQAKMLEKYLESIHDQIVDVKANLFQISQHLDPKKQKK